MFRITADFYSAYLNPLSLRIFYANDDGTHTQHMHGQISGIPLNRAVVSTVQALVLGVLLLLSAFTLAAASILRPPLGAGQRLYLSNMATILVAGFGGNLEPVFRNLRGLDEKAIALELGMYHYSLDDSGAIVVT
jgi:hypothetical protein